MADDDDMRATRTVAEQLRLEAINMAVHLESNRLNNTSPPVDGDAIITNATKFYRFLKKGPA